MRREPTSAGLLGIACDFPERHMPNTFWIEHHEKVVADLQNHALSKVFKAPVGDACLFDECMKPYLNDPFRGAVDRRWLRPDESLVSLEVKAVQKLCKAMGRSTADIDLCMVGALPRDHYEVGDAAFLAEQLKLGCAVVDVESACSQATVAFQMACALIESGRYRNIVVVSSCAYSRLTKEAEPLGWASGDGASAMWIGKVDDGSGYLTGHTISTWETNCAITFHPTNEGAEGEPPLRMRANRESAAKLRDTAEPFIKTCIGETLRKANVAVDDVAFFVCNTPLAWYADFCSRAIGFPAHKMVNTHPLYANTGPVLMPQNLLHAAHEKKMKTGDLVCFYGVGSSSNASAALVRWTEPALGPLP
ncbi:MAG: 3-oxoacyl-[acyl-carrier-protein] synthase III C-terminal domain-containing protein [Deltaproteobacteria bacterium]|nr:3-oxoacyl-[acyl-carrier-protein] synthase III C-terminal domain-containing protein [Deltaproteobacteria bacterium]